MTIFLSMHTIPPRQRATLARRIAAGLPVWAAARGSNLPAEDVGQLMGEPEFRELIGAWAEILDMDPEARKERLLKLAGMIVEQKLEEGCRRTALFVQREYARKRDPVRTLAKGFCQLVELERARAERARALPEAGPQAPEPAPSPVQAVAAEALAAARLRRPAHPDDAAMWRKASRLRHDMLGEQLLFAAAAGCEAAERRKVPLELHEVDAIEARQVAIFEARQAEAAQAMPKPVPPEHAPPSAAEPIAAANPRPDDEEPDPTFAARATATFNATLAQASPEIRARLQTFTQDQLWALIGRCWPDEIEDENGKAQPQGP
jgi:hypothetical protein